MTRGINDERPRGRRSSGDAKGVCVAANATALRESEKGLLVAINEGPPVQPSLPGFKARDPRPRAGDEIWVPKGQIHDDSEVYAVGHEGKLIVSAWLASKEGWG